MKVGLVSVLIGILGLSFNAHAAFVHVSSPVFGVGSITYDSNQNLNWLSPNATVGMSYNQVNGMLRADSRFSGFRYATVTELTQLFTDFVIPDINVYGLSVYGTEANVLGATTLQTYLGVTYSTSIWFGSPIMETAGLVGSPYVSTINGFTQVYGGDVVTQNVATISNGVVPYAYVATTLSSLNLGDGYQGVGSFLVSNVPVSNVPIPSAWALMIAGLLCCWYFSARKVSPVYQMTFLASTCVVLQDQLTL